MASDGQDVGSGGNRLDGDGPDDERLGNNEPRSAKPDRPFFFLGLKGVIGASVLFSVLSLIGISFANTTVLVPLLPGLVASLVIYAAAIGALGFSARLAVLASVWLALCFLWSFGILAIARIDLVPETIAAVFAVNAVNALVVAQLIYGVTVELWRDMSVEAAIRKGLKRWATPGAVAVAAILVSLLVLAPLEPVWISTLFATGMAVIAAAVPVIFLGLPVSLSHMRFDESSVALANRHRERRENMLGRLAALATPRWAYAVIGIFVVLFAILVSEGGRAADLRNAAAVLLWRESGAALGLSVFAAGLIGAVTARDWRAALVCMTVPFLLATWGGVLSYHLQIASLAMSAKMLVIGGGFGAGMCVLLIDAIGVYRRFEDDVETASARAVIESGPVLLVTGLAIALAAAFFALLFGELSSASLVILIEVAGVIVIVPALVSVIDDIFPKRQSMEEL